MELLAGSALAAAFPRSDNASVLPRCSGSVLWPPQYLAVLRVRSLLLQPLLSRDYFWLSSKEATLSPAEFWRQSLFPSPPCRIPSHIQHRQGFAALPSCVQLPLSPVPVCSGPGEPCSPRPGRAGKHHWPGPAPVVGLGLRCCAVAQAQTIAGSPRFLCQEQLRSPQLPSWGNWRWLHSCRLRAELG